MFEKIKDFLTENEVVFKTLHHEITLTSEDSAKVRGESLAIGGKALIIKVDKTFSLFVISAARKLDSKAIKKYFSAKKSRFASRDELLEMTGLVPGSVPPFGKPIIELDLFVDESVTENERIAFNAGSLTDSVIMQTTDYIRLANPTIFKFSKS